MKNLESDDAIFFLFVKPLALQVRELIEFGFSETEVHDHVLYAIRLGLREAADAVNKAGEGF